MRWKSVPRYVFYGGRIVRCWSSERISRRTRRPSHRSHDGLAVLERLWRHPAWILYDARSAYAQSQLPHAQPEPQLSQLPATLALWAIIFAISILLASQRMQCQVVILSEYGADILMKYDRTVLAEFPCLYNALPDHLVLCLAFKSADYFINNYYFKRQFRLFLFSRGSHPLKIKSPKIAT